MRTIELQPVDTLFFRDARPMQAGAGSGGHGAHWPLPTVMHEALRTALLRLSGTLPSGKTKSVRYRTPAGTKLRTFATREFESLRTIGPFPLRSGMLFFPAPADLITDSAGRPAILSPISSASGQSNLPASWLKPVASRVRAGKTPRWEWISKASLHRYLESAESMEAPEQAELFDSEHRIGIALDNRTRAAAEGKLYAAEHLRLRAGVTLWMAASLSKRDTAANSVNAIDRLMGECLTLGGESRMCRVLPAREDLLTQLPRLKDLRIKWVLATPAVFRGGWLPNWVSDGTGEVQLKAGDTERLPEEDRKAWRERVRAMPPIRARLVAACIPKSQAFSGWDLALDTNTGDDSVQPGGPKPTVLAVPGGAVFYFEAEDMESSVALVAALHCRTQSDFFGEKGMGFGFCGRWKPLA